MIGILEKVVDDGKLEYRIDLAMFYRQRSHQWDERQNHKNALKDAMQSLRIFRTIADDDRDLPDVHVAKVQWSELIHQIAVCKIKQTNFDEAFDFLRRELADVVRFYEEGNDCVIVDLLLGYTQYMHFVEVFGNHLDELKYPAEKFAQRLQEVQDCCRHGVELSLKKQNEPTKNLVAKLFFMMKNAFFYKAEGQIYRLLKNHELACQSFETSIERWYQLLGGLENLKAKDRYDAAEKGEPIPDWDIPGGADDPYQDRYIFYINELRETMQLGARAYLACDRKEEAKNLFEKENALSRELVQNGVENADRFLIVSLTSHAKHSIKKYPVKRTQELYDEALQVLHKRFESGSVVAEDFWVLKRIVKEYLEFLQSKKQIEDAYRISEDTTALLETVRTFPPPGLWMEVCMALETHIFYSDSPEKTLDICIRHRKLLRRHPEFKSDKTLKQYDSTLKNRLDTVKKAFTGQPEPEQES
jgi:tetratricopeptide (TPR) repeat protein